MGASASIGEQIAELGQWFHNLHLPDGSQTAPGHRFGDFPAFKWQRLAAAVPADPSEWSFDPWSGDVRDGFVLGRGGQDMKDQVAAEVAAGEYPGPEHSYD